MGPTEPPSGPGRHPGPRPVTGDHVVRVWESVARRSGSAPVTLAHLCDAVVGGVGVDGAGLTTMAGATVRETLHATDDVAARLGELQLTLGQGPSVDMFTGGGPVLVADLGTPEFLARWPAFAPAALELGARAVFAVPLRVGERRWGALEGYRTRAGGLGPRGLGDLVGYADLAGMMLLDAATRAGPETTELTWQGDGPAGHRSSSRGHAAVHQATGMLITQLGVDPEAAFARLRAYAYAHDRRLGDVARDVVDRLLRFEPEPPATMDTS